MKKQNQKTILIVTPYFPPHTGGLEHYVLNIAKGLIDTYGFHVVVATSTIDSRSMTIDKYHNITVYRLPAVFRFSNTPINPFWYFSLKKIIASEKPDLINAHAPVPFIADIAANVAGKIPLVLTYHAGTMKKRKVFADLIISIYENIILPRTLAKASHIICVSDFVKRTMMNKYLDKTTVVHPGVNTTLFHPNPKIKKGKHTAIFIGRYANMYPMKGLFYLIEAMKQLPYARLYIIGEKIKTNAKNVTFLGIKSEHEVAEHIQKASVLVLPSLAHMESFGMVLIEAMACKTSVIGTNIGGIPEVITDGVDGIIVPAQDSNAITKALEKILKNKKLAAEMGEKGFEKISRHYLWSHQVDKTYDVFKKFITI